MGRLTRRRGGAQQPRSGIGHATRIYDELLEEALQQTSSPESSRPLKKRKSQRSEVIVVDDEDGGEGEMEESASTKNDKEAVVISSNSSGDGGSGNEADEMEWDDVDLNTYSAATGGRINDAHIEQGQTSPNERHITLSRSPEKPKYLP